MSFDLFTYLSSLAFIYAYGRLVIHFAPGSLRYFLNEPHHWQKQLEKPRVLFHLVGLFFMHLMSSSYISAQSESMLIELISFLVFTLGFLLCQFSWTEKFRSSFLTRNNNSNITPSENFNFSISQSQITKLYNELNRYDLLDQDKTSLDDLNNVLLRDWTSHQSKIYLKLDGPSCREFYDNLVRRFPSSSSTLKNFFETSGVIFRANGKPYKYNTIKNAPTRTPVSKLNETISIIFDKLK